ncbi:MAG: prephenate dehydrogenase [Verrucomicrobiota bacterium]
MNSDINNFSKAEEDGTSLLPRSVGIVGLGLLGGSLGQCLKARFPDIRVLGYARRRESIDTALRCNAIDYGSTDAKNIVGDADLLVLCLPVDVLIDFVREHIDSWRSASLVTDVGSVKNDIVRDLTPLFGERNIDFIGSHPMAGSEKSGIENAFPLLYDKAPVFVTPTAERIASQKVEEVVAFWRAVGGKPVILEPAEHDRLVAGTSHLIHLLAAVAVDVVLEDDQSKLAAGTGFRDFSRIAAGSPDVWTQIFRQNRSALLDVMTLYREELDKFQDFLLAEDWDKVRNILSEARKKRIEWYDNWCAVREEQSE